MINVVHIKKHKKTDYDYLISRPSVLGNPYTHKSGTLAKYIVESRDVAVESYKEYILKEISNKNILIINALNEILIIHLQENTVNLICWCALQRCHGEVIREILEPYILENKFIETK